MLEAAPSVAVSVTVDERRLAKLWLALVVVTVADPSPKLHEYVVEGVVFDDVLVKLHVKPEHDLVKLAVSGGGGATSLPV